MADVVEHDDEQARSNYPSNRVLMDTIRHFRAIYDKSCPDYKDQRVKKNAWQAVATKLNIEVSSAQQRYNTIRTNFSKHIKNLKGKSGCGRDEVEIRPDYEYLRWLISHIKHRETRTNMKRSTDSPISTGSSSGTSCAIKESDDGVNEDDEYSSCEIIDTQSGFQHEMMATVHDEKTLPNDGASTSDERHASTSTATDSDSSSTKLNKPGQYPTKKGGKRPWSKQSGSDFSFENEVVKTMKQFNSVLQGGDQKRPGNDEDEDTLFCLSLVPKFKRIPLKYRSSLQLSVLKAFHDMELAIDQGSGIPPPPVPPHQFAPLVPQGQWYQQQLYQPQHDYQDTSHCTKMI